jgi:hypothetical protein
LGITGCTVDIDLTTSPDTVPFGGEVTFDVKVTNVSACPVGDISAIILPFVEPNSGTAEDDSLLDALCSGTLPGGDFPSGVECSVQGDMVVCGPSGPEDPVEGPEETLFESGTGANMFRCVRRGDSLTCRLPVAAAEILAEQAASPLSCSAVGPMAFCSANELDVGEMQSDSFVLAANTPGHVRNLAFVIANDDAGVCKTGSPGVPCSVDADCSGMGNSCGGGICSGSSGGAKDGFGCSIGNAGDCPGGTCTACGPPSGGDLSAGIACTETSVGVEAPAMSAWMLALTAAALPIATVLAQRRRQRE